MEEIKQVITDKYKVDYNRQSNLDDGKMLCDILLGVGAICIGIWILVTIMSDNVLIHKVLTIMLACMIIVVMYTIRRQFSFKIKVPRYNNCDTLFLYDNEYVATYDFSIKEVEPDKSKYITLNGKNEGFKHYLYFGNMTLKIDSREYYTIDEALGNKKKSENMVLILTTSEISSKLIEQELSMEKHK